MSYVAQRARVIYSFFLEKISIPATYFFAGIAAFFVSSRLRKKFTLYATNP
jgi:hypothetical protein